MGSVRVYFELAAEDEADTHAQIELRITLGECPHTMVKSRPWRDGTTGMYQRSKREGVRPFSSGQMNGVSTPRHSSTSRVDHEIVDDDRGLATGEALASCARRACARTRARNSTVLNGLVT